MLRLLLDWFSKNTNVDHNFNFHQDSKWFSEALLPTPFAPRKRGDSLGESRTHADGVIGQFVIGSKGKVDLELLQTATQFVVFEAKMSSKLASGIKNAPNYDQAARNVGCIAEVLKRAEIKAGDSISLGFYLLAPEAQISSNKFPEMDPESILEKVKERMESYEGDKDDWYQDWFLPLMEIIEIKKISWEEVIGFIASKDPKNGRAYKDFLENCLKYN